MNMVKNKYTICFTQTLPHYLPSLSFKVSFLTPVTKLWFLHLQSGEDSTSLIVLCEWNEVKIFVSKKFLTVVKS